MEHWLSISLSLTVLLSAKVLAQNLVQFNFQTNPVLVQTGSDIQFIVDIASPVLSMSWSYQTGETLGVWTAAGVVYNNGPQFQGRLAISANQLRIGGAQLRDAGTYTVSVAPIATSNLGGNSKTVELKVFDPVVGVVLSVPSVAVEDKNVSLSCTWTGGTEVTARWAKDGAAITPDSRITISGGSLVISPASRDDAGEYTCTASNDVSAQTSTQSLTVYCEITLTKTRGG